jgi:hypothetical protein
MQQKPVAEPGDGNNADMMSVDLAMQELIRRYGHSKFEETVKPTYYQSKPSLWLRNPIFYCHQG